MATANPPREVPVRSLVLVPAILTFAITALRLTGELLNWSPSLFNKEAGGGGALVGISWLIVVFGIFFAVRLAGIGDKPAGRWRPLGFGLLGFLLAFLALGATALGASFPWQVVAWAVFSLAALPVAWSGWPTLARTLLSYALAARIPVALLMLFAIFGNWGTHYDVNPPNWQYPDMGPLPKWLLIGLLPQLTVWIWMTVVGGMILGGLVYGLFYKRWNA
jgi:hypothetical protein